MAAGQAEQLSHQRILVDSEQFAFKTYLSLKEVMPTLIKDKVIPSKLGKAFVKKNQVENFVGMLKNKPIEDFVVFMEAIAKTFPDNENHRILVRLMMASLSRIALPHSSDTYKRIKAVTTAAAKEYQSRPLSEVEPSCPQPQSEQPSMTLSPSQDETSEKPPELIPSLHSASVEDDDTLRTTELESKPEPVPIPSSEQSGRKKANPPEAMEPMKPPNGHIQPTRSQYFKREDGGVFYCPAHDITICIPANASPPHISKFMVNTRAYMEGPFKLPDDIEPCMPVVWVGLTPNFTFEKSVTLKMPHCAVIESESDFFLLRGSKGPGSSMYEFTEVLKADFTDGYHVVAQLNHFCPIAAGRKKRTSSTRRRTGSDGVRKKKSHAHNKKMTREGSLLAVTPDLVRQSSSTSSVASSSVNSPPHSFESSLDEHPSSTTPQASLEHDSPHLSQCHLARQEAIDKGSGRQVLLSTQQSSSEAHVSCNKMYMTRCVQQQGVGRWEVTFLVTCFHPTGILSFRQKIGGSSSSCLFQPTNHYLEFEPATWEENGWSVQATQTPQICVEDVSHIHFTSNDEANINAGCYPPCLAYMVDGSGASNPLKCRIDIRGADANGRELFFVLTLDTPATQTQIRSERHLQTWSQLYSEVSKISQALSGSIPNPCLDPDEPDLLKLLADISFQLTSSDLAELPILLKISQPKVDRIQHAYLYDLAEQAYQMLRSWVASNYLKVTLTILLSLFEKIGFSGIELCMVTKHFQIATCSRVEKESISDDKFILEIGKKLGQRWKYVARFLGLCEGTIDLVEYAYPRDLFEQSFQMLLRWQREKGDEATYGALLRAIHRVWEHEPETICGAWTYATQFCYGSSIGYQ